MKFCIITHVNHYQEQNKYFAYAPYVREMNIWLQFVDEVIIVAPLEKKEKTPIDIAYGKERIIFKIVPTFNITTVKQLVKTLCFLPVLFYTVYKAMQKADHIHLRCPGNMGLIGCLAQVFFPKKKKTAKYAGNWDPKAKQSLSYILQKWILSNTFLTKNMQVLVYGEWPNQTKNSKPFFTATYSEKEIQNSAVLLPKIREELQNSEKYKFIFVGTLSKGKQPLYAIQVIEQLHLLGKKVSLEVYGEGILRKELEHYIKTNALQKLVSFKGNQTKETITAAYQESCFLILASKSEGWPKVVAEAMFWGCVPVVTPVSCVPYMLDNGNRGILLQEQLEQDVKQIISIIMDHVKYELMRYNGMKWSRQFTTDKFASEIKELI